MSQFNDLRALATKWYRDTSELVPYDNFNNVMEFIEWAEKQTEEKL